MHIPGKVDCSLIYAPTKRKVYSLYIEFLILDLAGTYVLMKYNLIGMRGVIAKDVIWKVAFFSFKYYWSFNSSVDGYSGSNEMQMGLWKT